jgi:hypothetical protein
MNTRTIIALFFAVSFFVSCQKDIEYPQGPIYEAGPQTFGWSTSEKNGLPFESSAHADAVQSSELGDELFAVHFVTYTDWGAQRELISMGPFEYKLEKKDNVVENIDFDDIEGIINSKQVTASYGTSADDGDVAEDSYVIDERGDNWATITAIDTIDGEVVIRGEYNLHFKFKNNRDKKNAANPDHIRFTDGVFEVRFWN